MHVFSNIHQTMWNKGLRGHCVKCMPNATLSQLCVAVMGYLDTIGAGYTTDGNVRFADNLGNLVIGWAMSDLRVYHSEAYMLSGALRSDLVRMASLLKFHPKTVWIIGGSAAAYRLGEL